MWVPTIEPYITLLVEYVSDLLKPHTAVIAFPEKCRLLLTCLYETEALHNSVHVAKLSNIILGEATSKSVL